MGLNYSSRSVSRAHISEDNPVSHVRVIGNGNLEEGVSENNVEIYSRSCNVSRLEASYLNFSCGRDCCSSLEPTSVDIVGHLPSYPFGMDIKTTFTATTSRLEDLEDYLPSSFQFDHNLALSTYEGDVGVERACNVENVGCGLNMVSTREVDGAFEFEGELHEAFTYVLSHLRVKDLLSVERVCNSPSSIVLGDPLFWTTIHIHRPPCERITDVGLMQIGG
ncbi:hypothetical protein SASPL_115898 [Salvia splendens]|uniref:F-box domain-containing protein n=1 Tax=Salvia splendens TaxID=180675 RepID=A0A8X8Y903_SALSN|nr:hypothetical protein SASPL_115898 [Salvia splendens]